MFVRQVRLNESASSAISSRDDNEAAGILHTRCVLWCIVRVLMCATHSHALARHGVRRSEMLLKRYVVLILKKRHTVRVSFILKTVVWCMYRCSLELCSHALARHRVRELRRHGTSDDVLCAREIVVQGVRCVYSCSCSVFACVCQASSSTRKRPREDFSTKALRRFLRIVLLIGVCCSCAFVRESSLSQGTEFEQTQAGPYARGSWFRV